MKSVQIQRFFWSVFSRIRTEYGKIFLISLHLVRIWEYTDQKKTPYLDTFHAVLLIRLISYLEDSVIRVLIFLWQFNLSLFSNLYGRQVAPPVPACAFC